MTGEEWLALQEGLYKIFMPLVSSWVILAIGGTIAVIVIVVVVSMLRGIRL
jgi:hypothetical protein